MAVTITDLVGIWNMVHDDWAGTLVIRPPDQRQNIVDGACVHQRYVIDGTYTGGDGVARAVRGTFQGRDGRRRRGEACTVSDHLVEFTIAFEAAAPQSFEGYLFTHQRRTLAGYTWWEGIPFGWYARKRS